jgi:hypothetical protein
VSIERCRLEIAAIETELLAGNPDVAGLLLALSDWNAEWRILENEKGRQGEPGGLVETTDRNLSFDRVTPLPFLAFGGSDGQAQLLADGTGKEARTECRRLMPLRNLTNRLKRFEKITTPTEVRTWVVRIVSGDCTTGPIYGDDRYPPTIVQWPKPADRTKWTP